MSISALHHWLCRSIAHVPGTESQRESFVKLLRQVFIQSMLICAFAWLILMLITLPRRFQSIVPRPDASFANTLRTSDWDMPNCRAISDGLMPALNAARTALTCPRVNETVATSACCL
jgi:hypothetical protein